MERSDVNPALVQRAITNAVGTLKMTASMHFNVKGGPNLEYLQKMRDALSSPAEAGTFLLQNGMTIERVRTALIVLLYAAPEKLQEVVTYIDELLTAKAAA